MIGVFGFHRAFKSQPDSCTIRKKSLEVNLFISVKRLLLWCFLEVKICVLSIAFEPKLPDSISIFRPLFIALFAYVKCSSFLEGDTDEQCYIRQRLSVFLAECITNSA